MKKKRITIGIPAYNEGQNIADILRALLKQRYKNILLSKIIVVSDGSTDDTVEKARWIRDGKISIFVEKVRKGKAHAVASIIAQTTTDMLVLLDADILIQDKRFIEKLMRPILRKEADLTSAKIVQLPPINFFQKLLYWSMRAKMNVFEEFRKGDNVYTCHGTSRGMSRRFYKAIDFTNAGTGEDAYTYLFCKKNGFTYQYVTDTHLLYQLPKKLEDHERQSVRFLQSKRLLYSVYGPEFVQSEFYLPRNAMLKSFLTEFFAHPLHTFLYWVIFLYMNLKGLFTDRTQSLWLVARTTKKLTCLLSLALLYD